MIKFEMLNSALIQGVLDIEKQCFPGEEWTAGMFESEISNSISVFPVGIDEESGRVVCYFCVWLISDFAEITNIAVSPAYQRQGIGQMMLGLIEKICRENNVECINLEVKNGNMPAQQLYLKLGYKEVGRRKNYYKDGSEAVLMTKHLITKQKN